MKNRIHTKCPVTSLPIITSEEYSNVNFGNNFVSNFKKIGDNILYMHGTGNVKYYNDSEYQKIADRFITDFEIKKPYIFIRDLTQHEGMISLSESFHFKDYADKNKDNIAAIVFISKQKWLKLLVNSGIKLLSPKVKYLVFNSYIEALSHITTTNSNFRRYHKGKITYHDLIFKPEWEYLNPEKNFKYKVGVIPGEIVYTLFDGKTDDINDFKRSMDLLDLIVGITDFTGRTTIDITDYSNYKDITTIKTKRFFANEVNRINIKYNCPPRLSIIVGANTYIKTTHKLFSLFVDQRFVFVNTIEQAFDVVNEYMSSAKNAGNDEITITKKDIEDTVYLCGSLMWSDYTGVENYSNLVSDKNPLKPIQEAISIVGDEIKRKEFNYKNLIDSINSGVLISDAASKEIIYANTYAASILGTQKENLVHQKCYDFLCKKKENSSSGSCICFRDKEFIVQNNSDDKKFISLSIIEDVFENRLCDIHTFTDITDLKNAEIERENHLKELSENKKKLLSTLEEVEFERNKANDASRIKSEFLANMSHEIRTPLNGVIGFTDLLKTTPLSLVQQQYVNNANVSGHTLLGIINDILDLSKIEAGMLHLEMIKTDMLELLENSIDLVKFAAGKKDIELLLNIDPTLPRFAITDPIRLKQILANLLGNAVKFTEQGEVELKVTYLQFAPKKGKISFFVRDTGIGIPDSQKEKLFKSFSQADSSTTRKYGGTGLGLSISNLIAQKMDSSIQFDSKQGEGSVFYFDIVTDTEEGEKLVPTAIENIKRCLVIDDNANNRHILEDMLANWGIVCESCDNGLTALKQMETSKPFDVMICDYQMPYMDGLETIRLIREKLYLSQTKLPIILLHSSSDNEELHQKCDELNVRFRLTKPVKSNDLFSYLCQVYKPEQEAAIYSIAEKPELVLNTGKTKLLIVEDVHMNRLMIKAILGQIIPGAEVVEAKNGREAVSLYGQVRPDLIFMDIQMPEMNGMEATQQIRKIEQQNGRHTPIIALTAGVFKEEQERCFDAGMDDFLTKPVDTKKIAQVLRKYLVQKPEWLDAVHFSKQMFLEWFGDQDLVEELISLTLVDFPQKLKELRKLIVNKEVDGVREIAHQLKGASLNLGCSGMATIATEMEEMATGDNNLLLLFEKYNALQAEWKIVKKQMEE